jgi:eukaryotic-like serine/threonine-protein kinase
VVPEPVQELVLRGLDKDPSSRPDARSLFNHVGEVAARAVGSGWEPRGRRELAALVADRSRLPDVLVPTGPKGNASREHRRPVRLTAVMGGALALAAGIASPPLAVIVPGGSIFGFAGKSPVLAFPEPDHNAAPVRVVTNGPLNRAILSGAKATAAGPVTDPPPAAPSIPAPRIQTAPYEHPTPAVHSEGSTQPDGTVPSSATPDHSASGQSTPATQACTPQLIADDKPCTAAGLGKQTPDTPGTPSDPSQVSIPVAMPIPVPVELPARVQVPAPIQVPKPLLVREKIKHRKDVHTPKSFQTERASQSSEKEEWTDQSNGNTKDVWKSGRGGNPHATGHFGER